MAGTSSAMTPEKWFNMIGTRLSGNAMSKVRSVENKDVAARRSNYIDYADIGR
jgi:hypothetical protein